MRMYMGGPNIMGDLNITKCNQDRYKNIVEVTGYLCVSRNATIDFSLCEKIGGNLFVHGKAKLKSLTTVRGSISVYKGAKLYAPNLETVGGYISAYVEAEAPITLDDIRNIWSFFK